MVSELSVANIEEASLSISPRFTDTPQFEDPGLSDHFGTPVVVKVECMNLLRSFKGRGADYCMSKVEKGRPVITASAGNFGQAIAWAGATRALDVRVFAARTANKRKVDRMRALGAEVTLVGDDFDSAKAAARDFAASHPDGLFVEDGREPAISEGAGTIGLELAHEDLDTLLVPLGNGALVTGVGTWMKVRSPQTRIIGVVAEAAPSMLLSWQRKAEVPAQAATIADGIAIRIPVPAALSWMEATVDDVVSVSETSIYNAMVLVRDTLGLTLEPAAAVGVAALIEDPGLCRGRVGTILTGSNISDELARALHGGELVTEALA
ncbi:threonine/serine dehydratase [Nocardia sp. NPDC059246]|uniref:threonine ammonia-lyase n=1 Tax=unclassified Nocardia TaxID=2637762 RepID=UPI00367FFC5C